MSRAHLLAMPTPHGFGHVAQLAPVLEALHRRRPGLRLTVRATVPEEKLRSLIGAPFEYLPEAVDFGMAMASAVEVRPEASLARYAGLHRDFGARVAAEAERLRALGPDLIVANMPYLTLAAAAEAGVPAVGLGSLTWPEVFAAYCGHLPGAGPILAEMRRAQARATLTLRIEPGMPMAGLGRVVDVGPVARRGRRRRGELERRVGCRPGERLVLVSLGGIETPLPVAAWPVTPGLRWLVPASWRIDRTDFAAFDALGLPYHDVLASVDAAVCKMGYGMFVEAGCLGLPVVYRARGDWPEEPHLVPWLRRHGRCAAVDQAALEAGAFVDLLRDLWARPAPPPVDPHGVEEAAELLLGYLPDGETRVARPCG